MICGDEDIRPSHALRRKVEGAGAVGVRPLLVDHAPFSEHRRGVRGSHEHGAHPVAKKLAQQVLQDRQPVAVECLPQSFVPVADILFGKAIVASADQHPVHRRRCSIPRADAGHGRDPRKTPAIVRGNVIEVREWLFRAEPEPCLHDAGMALRVGQWVEPRHAARRFPDSFDRGIHRAAVLGALPYEEQGVQAGPTGTAQAAGQHIHTDGEARFIHRGHGTDKARRTLAHECRAATSRRIVGDEDHQARGVLEDVGRGEHEVPSEEMPAPGRIAREREGVAADRRAEEERVHAAPGEDRSRVDVGEQAVDA